MQVQNNKDLELFALAPGSTEARANGCICPAADGEADNPKLGCPVHGTQRLLKVLETFADQVGDDPE